MLLLPLLLLPPLPAPSFDQVLVVLLLCCPAVLCMPARAVLRGVLWHAGVLLACPAACADWDSGSGGSWLCELGGWWPGRGASSRSSGNRNVSRDGQPSRIASASR